MGRAEAGQVPQSARRLQSRDHAEHARDRALRSALPRRIDHDRAVDGRHHDGPGGCRREARGALRYGGGRKSGHGVRRDLPRAGLLAGAPELDRAEFDCAPDYPFGIDREWREQTQKEMRRAWGQAAILELQAPEVAGDARFRDWYGRFERYGASPGIALSVLRMVHDLDVRHVLPTIQCPALVLHREGDQVVRVEHGRYLTERIPRARYVELPGQGHAYWSGDSDRILAEIQRFLTGAAPVPAADRVLVTVLFTDIVASTQTAARLGDDRWARLLHEHRLLVRQELHRFRGREMNTAGDAFVAIFDGPARAIRCAAAIRDAMRSIGVELRAGLHTGEVEMRGDYVAGIALHIGQRVQAEADPGEVVVSRTVVDLVAGSGIRFTDRGTHKLKGVPERWQLYAAHVPDEAAP